MEENKNQKPDVGKALEVLFASDYLNKKKLYWHNFLRGVVFGAGSLLGATIVVAILVWVLSLFDTIPLIGPLIDNTTETIKKR
jgi:hypothetical protein